MPEIQMLRKIVRGLPRSCRCPRPTSFHRVSAKGGEVRPFFFFRTSSSSRRLVCASLYRHYLFAVAEGTFAKWKAQISKLDFQIAPYKKTINKIVSNLRSEQLVQHDSSPDGCLWFRVNRWQNTNGFLEGKKGIGISSGEGRSCTLVPTVDYGITF